MSRAALWHGPNVNHQLRDQAMDNIRKWLIKAEQDLGETIEAIVVGMHYKAGPDDARDFDENVVLSREAGLAKLDEEFDSEYGGADCYPMYAWTESYVFFIGEYDGMTRLSKIPRNPVNCIPDFNGD
jgi:hypothetical protein